MFVVNCLIFCGLVFLVGSNSIAESNAALASSLNKEEAEVGKKFSEENVTDDAEMLALMTEAGGSFFEKSITLPILRAGFEQLEGDSFPLHVRRALDLALGNSHGYAIAVAQADQASYAAKASRGQMGPTLDLRAQRGREYSSPASVLNANGQVVLADTHKRWDTSLIARQPIWAPGSYFDYRKQNALSDAADKRQADAQELLYYTTIKAYYDVLLAYVSLKFARTNSVLIDELLEYMRKRLEGGGASKIDFDRVRGRSLQAQSILFEREAALEVATITLSQLVGRRVGEILLPRKMMPCVPLTAQLALSAAYGGSSAIEAARSDTAAVREELLSARSKFSPNLSVELSQVMVRGAGGDQRLNTDRRLMLVMTMNLLNGGSDVYYQKQIGAKLVEKTNAAAEIERKVRESIEISYRTYDAVEKRMVVSREAYKANSDVASLYGEQLLSGGRQLIDVLDAYQQAYQARQEYASLLFRKADIGYQIIRSIGQKWSCSGERLVDLNRK